MSEKIAETDKVIKESDKDKKITEMDIEKIEEPNDRREKKIEEPNDREKKIEEPNDREKKIEEPNDSEKKIEEPNDREKKIEEPPVVEPDDDDGVKCVKCQKRFHSSWLFYNFRYKCCNECRDQKGEHKLITKTRALNEYLLKEFHLEKKENPLWYIETRNPHKRSWAPMKLYLRLQVEELALDVWGSKEKLEIERKNRKERKAASAKAKKESKYEVAVEESPASFESDEDELPLSTYIWRSKK